MNRTNCQKNISSVKQEKTEACKIYKNHRRQMEYCENFAKGLVYVVGILEREQKKNGGEAILVSQPTDLKMDKTE
jgi:hypothetical protein